MNTDSAMVLRLVGRIVQEKRKKMNFSQEDLAKLTGVKRTSITNMEAGRQNISVTRLVEIADALNCDIKELLPRIR